MSGDSQTHRASHKHQADDSNASINTDQEQSERIQIFTLKCKHGCYSSGSAVYFPWQPISSGVFRNTAQSQPPHGPFFAMGKWRGWKLQWAKHGAPDSWPSDRQVCGQRKRHVAADYMLFSTWWCRVNQKGKKKEDNRGLKAEEPHEKQAQ